MSRRIAFLLALALPTQALAWRHTGHLWFPQELPLPYEVSEYVEDSLPAGYTIEAIQYGHSAWNVAECADKPHTYVGSYPQNSNSSFDYVNRVNWDDPAGIQPPGVMAWNITLPPNGVGEVTVLNGTSYGRARDSDILFNDNIDWGTDEDIQAGRCNGESSVKAVATHEIGHLWGLGHSCEDGEACTAPDLIEATMFWSAGPCDTTQSTPEQDDITAITLLYGPSATFQCSNELDPGAPDTLAVGNVPFDLKCITKTRYMSELDSVTWYWGDGEVTESSPDFETTHTYERPGNFTVRAVYEGTSDICGEWEFPFRREGYVRACDVPDVSFDVQHLNGRTYQLLNETDLSVYGCVFDVQWDIFEGETPTGEPIARLRAWEPEFTFESNGTYTVVLNVGGPAGTAAQELTVNVRNRRGESYGCTTTGLGGFGLLPLLLVAAPMVTRRRRG